MEILGTPLGHPAHVQSFLRAKTEDHALLLRPIPEVPDMQSAQLIFLFCVCFNESKLSAACVASLCHGGVCCQSGQVVKSRFDQFVGQSAVGRQMGISQSAPQLRGPWSSQRFPFGGLLGDGEGHAPSRYGSHRKGSGPQPSLPPSAKSSRSQGVKPNAPDWEALADGQRPDREGFIEDSPGVLRHGWQCKTMGPVDEGFLEGVVRPRLLGAQQLSCALKEAHSGALPFTSFPSAPHGLPFDSCGRHRAACAVAEVLCRKGLAVESAAVGVLGSRREGHDRFLITTHLQQAHARACVE